MKRFIAGFLVFVLAISQGVLLSSCAEKPFYEQTLYDEFVFEERYTFVKTKEMNTNGVIYLDYDVKEYYIHTLKKKNGGEIILKPSTAGYNCISLFSYIDIPIFYHFNEAFIYPNCYMNIGCNHKTLKEHNLQSFVILKLDKSELTSEEYEDYDVLSNDNQKGEHSRQFLIVYFDYKFVNKNKIEIHEYLCYPPDWDATM